MARNDERSLEQYATLSGALNQLNDQMPAIIQLYEDTQSRIEQERAQMEHDREDLQNILASAQSLITALKSRSDELDMMQTELERRIAENEHLHREYSKVLQNATRKANQQYREWQKRMEGAESEGAMALGELSPMEQTIDRLVAAYDYNDSGTVTKIFNKYKNLGPVIVRRNNWGNDHACLIRSIDGGWVDGLVFRNGVPTDSATVPSAGTTCKIFHGPSQREIIRYALAHGSTASV